MSSKLEEYDTYYITGHGSIDPSAKLFTKVPTNMIFVMCTQNFDSVMICDEVEKKFTEDLIKYGDNYLRKSLLVDNNDLPLSHLLKNKIIYMEGSCVPNLTLKFRDQFLSTGIFKVSSLKKSSIGTDKKYIQNVYSLMQKTLFHSDDVFITLENILNSRYFSKNKNIVYMSMCTAIWFNKLFQVPVFKNIMDLNPLPDSEVEDIIENLSEKDKITIKQEFVSSLEECNRNCYLNSLEKFSTTFPNYDSDKIPSYLVEGAKITDLLNKEVNIKNPFNIISNRQINSYVDEFFKKTDYTLFDSILKWLGLTKEYPISLSLSKSNSKSSIYSPINDEDMTKLSSYLEEEFDNYKKILEHIEFKNKEEFYEYKDMKKFVCKQTDEILDTDLLVIKKRKRTSSSRTKSSRTKSSGTKSSRTKSSGTKSSGTKSSSKPYLSKRKKSRRNDNGKKKIKKRYINKK